MSDNLAPSVLFVLRWQHVKDFIILAMLLCLTSWLLRQAYEIGFYEGQQAGVLGQWINTGKTR